MDIAAVEIARQGVLGYLRPFRLSDQVINRIEVVLEELISNVVRHPIEVDELLVEAKCIADGVSLKIEDNGPAFNPLAVATPARFTNLEGAKLGGQGILLVKRLTESLQYERIDAVNRVRAVVATR